MSDIITTSIMLVYPTHFAVIIEKKIVDSRNSDI